jgi:predicted enzyme related to lactoylglutathione lyase
MSKYENPVTWFEIYVENMERAKNFYEQVFDCVLVSQPTDGSFELFQFPDAIHSNGAMGALVKHPMRKPSLDGTLIYFNCDDCAIQSSIALQNGGQLFKPKWSIGPNGYLAIIGDTEGNAIGLHSFD